MTSWLHRCAVIAAAFTLLAILSGAWVTSTRAIVPPPSTPVSIHLTTASIAAGLVILLGIWLLVGKVRALGWMLLAAAIAEGGLGSSTAVISQAVLAHILFALTLVAVFRTSKAWADGPEFVVDQGWPSLRSMGVATPVLVMAQVVLGAAYRHKAMGLTWHIVGAMVVALTVLIVGMCTMQAYPKHRALRFAAVLLLSVVLAQVMLGIATITTEMLAPDNVVPVAVILSTMGHVAVGSLTLASSLVLAIQIRRNVQKAVEEPEEGETAVGA
ncbi:MAG TPA: hypothetical protein VH639_27255 [Bryobacteraceae bacterium]